MSDGLSRQDHAEDRRTRVAVVFGGTSSEHGVSCLTAAGVLGALDPERYEVLGIGITRSGRWVLVDDATLARLQVTDGRLPELSEDAADAVLLREGAGTGLGTQIVQTLVANELNGSIEWLPRDGGGTQVVVDVRLRTPTPTP